MNWKRPTKDIQSRMVTGEKTKNMGIVMQRATRSLIECNA